MAPRQLTFHALMLLVLVPALALIGCNSSSSPAQSPSGPVTVAMPAAGVAVSDLEAALHLYVAGMGMTEIERLERSDRIEVVLESADARGSRLMLMSFTDGLTRPMGHNPGKLVFYVNDPGRFAADFAANGGTITLPPAPQEGFGGVVVGFGRDTDNNLIEIVGYPQAAHSFLSAVGIGVSNLQAARDFYVNTIGFAQDQFLSIPGMYDEYILETAAGSSALVLMHWATARNYTDIPVKLVLEASDPQALATQIEAAGERVAQAPAASSEPGLEGRLVGLALDADGYELELRSPEAQAPGE